MEVIKLITVFEGGGRRYFDLLIYESVVNRSRTPLSLGVDSRIDKDRLK